MSTNLLNFFLIFLYPGGINNGASGKPVDDYDSICKQLHSCHVCIERDYSEFLDASWNAYSGKYKWSTTSTGDITCSGNTEQHKKDLCECDAQFARSMGQSWDDSTYNFTMWNNKNNALFDFDFNNKCVVSLSGSHDECCGDFPNRRPFDSGKAECCSSTNKVAPFGVC